MADRHLGAQRPLFVDVTPDDAGVTISVAGELDAHTSPRLRSRLLEAVDAGTDDVVVDLAGVTFCDSTGLGVLVGAHRRMAAGGRTLSVQSVRPAVRHLLQVSGLDQVLHVR